MPNFQIQLLAGWQVALVDDRRVFFHLCISGRPVGSTAKRADELASQAMCYFEGTGNRLLASFLSPASFAI